MIVRDILESSAVFPTTVTDATVEAAASLMRKHDVRAVSVVESDRLIGIVTDWDIVDAFAQRSGELGSMPVSAIMTRDDLATIDIDATVIDATKVLQERRVHHLPVVENDMYRGMICLGLEWSQPHMLTAPMQPTLTARHP